MNKGETLIRPMKNSRLFATSAETTPVIKEMTGNIINIYKIIIFLVNLKKRALSKLPVANLLNGSISKLIKTKVNIIANTNNVVIPNKIAFKFLISSLYTFNSILFV